MAKVVLTRFNLNRKGIAAIAVSREVRAAVHDVAENKAKPFAISISPRSRARHKHYADSFHVEDTIVADIGAPPMARVASRLVNTAPQAIIVEKGADRTPAHRVLGRTLEQLAALGKLS
jgi:hypothetical protein